MNREIKIGEHWVGDNHPVFITAEIGINHNGDINIAKRLIDLASEVGCDAVKFQKRTPELCVPQEQRNKMRETPWGYISYLEYRHKVEFGYEEYKEIDNYCKQKHIIWFASCWDEKSVDFIEQFDPPCYKIQSASVTDLPLLSHIKKTKKPIVLSTGMSTMEQIERAVEHLGTENLLILHCTSTYPCAPEELNIRMIETLKKRFPCLVGYSGHEVGLPTTIAAVALGACYVERHITLDRAMWGSDQSASVERQGWVLLLKYIRVTEKAMGDGVKRLYDSEIPLMNRLRRIN